MSRYIDAEYCEDFFDRWESRVKNAEPVTIDVVQNTRTLLREAPNIDIVFCKDCRKTKDDFIKGDKLVWCGKWKTVMEVNEFCSRGERREP